MYTAQACEQHTDDSSEYKDSDQVADYGENVPKRKNREHGYNESARYYGVDLFEDNNLYLRFQLEFIIGTIQVVLKVYVIDITMDRCGYK